MFTTKEILKNVLINSYYITIFSRKMLFTISGFYFLYCKIFVVMVALLLGIIFIFFQIIIKDKIGGKTHKIIVAVFFCYFKIHLFPIYKLCAI